MGHSVFTMITQLVWYLLIIASSLVLCQDKPPMTSISQVYNCTPAFVPQTQSVVCDGLNSTIAHNIFYHLEFRVLEKNSSEFPDGVGLCNLSVRYMDKFRTDLKLFAYTVDFNSSMQLGYISGLNDCKSGRLCNVIMLNDILQLPIFNKQFWPWGQNSLWNFSSPAFNMKDKWLQGLSVENDQYFIGLSFLTSLQNTSIQSLSITDLKTVNVMHLQHMPLLKTIHLTSVNNVLFHPDCFIGTPQVENLTIETYQTKTIPSLLTRLPNLRYLKFSNLNYSDHVSIATEKLSSLHNLESLTIENMAVVPISFKLPILPGLKKLTLSKCQISTLAEGDFVNFPALEELNLSGNELPSLKKDTFINLRHLKVLNLSRNKLLNWPVLYQCSLKVLDLSQNALETVANLGKTGTTVEFLNISRNKIAWWENKDVFSQDDFGSSSPIVFPYTHPDSSELEDSYGDYDGISNIDSLTTDGEVENKLLCSVLLGKFPLLVKRIETEVDNTKGNYTLLVKALNHLKNLVSQGSSAKPFNYSLPEDDSLLLNALGCSKHFAALGLSMQNVGLTETEDNDAFDGPLWVKSIDLSNNNFFNGLSEEMIQSLAGLQHLDLGGNPYNCDTCKMLPFQKWLNSTSTNITNFGISAPLRCVFPPQYEGLRIAEVHFDPCPREGISTGAIAGITVGILLVLICIICGLVYKYRFRRAMTDGFTQF